MFWRPELYRHPQFRVGVRDMLPQTPGTAAWGLMTGVAMAKSGLSLVESLSMALLVFAGSSQLASLPLLVAGAPMWVILATGFCVNLRFVVFSLHLRNYLMHLPLARRLVTGYLTTDMSYAILTRRHPHAAADEAGRHGQLAHLAGSCLANWLSWMLPSLAGIVLANFIPVEWGLGFAGILCLLGVMATLGTTRLRLVSAAVAGATAVAAYALPFKLNIVLAIGVAVLACLALEGRPRLTQAQP
ncbi:AzlC family ABC transporter permease [Ramlibacter rhizophilus]|uniref:Branched-chain amino acid ABC transporter permease n=1 Tax=Ramlibacter rhizophilus TaxID=1781167 RepID=A0A4Z0BIA2_9BURK|nr:AzlC family ABC transporter permease [Ramlibacter rhizophilus]TFY97864.1 branched-chain amino acid ABC transporter permease [Ramlibacter rhizophilus]